MPACIYRYIRPDSAASPCLSILNCKLKLLFILFYMYLYIEVYVYIYTLDNLRPFALVCIYIIYGCPYTHVLQPPKGVCICIYIYICISIYDPATLWLDMYI